MTTPIRTFNAAAIALADHLDDTARANRIGAERFNTMNALRTAADALYLVAEMIAEGRSMDDPEVALYRRIAAHYGAAPERRKSTTRLAQIPHITGEG